MRKENGRLEPAEEKELADLKGKHFKCEKCGSMIILAKVEFGLESHCTECDGLMIEQI